MAKCHLWLTNVKWNEASKDIPFTITISASSPSDPRTAPYYKYTIAAKDCTGDDVFYMSPSDENTIDFFVRFLIYRHDPDQRRDVFIE